MCTNWYRNDLVPDHCTACVVECGTRIRQLPACALGAISPVVTAGCGAGSPIRVAIFEGQSVIRRWHSKIIPLLAGDTINKWVVLSAPFRFASALSRKEAQRRELSQQLPICLTLIRTHEILIFLTAEGFQTAHEGTIIAWCQIT